MGKVWEPLHAQAPPQNVVGAWRRQRGTRDVTERRRLASDDWIKGLACDLTSATFGGLGYKQHQRMRRAKTVLGNQGFFYTIKCSEQGS